VIGLPKIVDNSPSIAANLVRLVRQNVLCIRQARSSKAKPILQIRIMKNQSVQAEVSEQLRESSWVYFALAQRSVHSAPDFSK
jgi:hypothetical protein